MIVSITLNLLRAIGKLRPCLIYLCILRVLNCQDRLLENEPLEEVGGATNLSWRRI